MKRYLIVTLAVLAAMALAAPAWATNGYQIIGIGQNQKSMGGAVTAAPMDAMTAITNPAGMARIGKRADFSMEAFMPKRSVDFDKTGGGDKETGGTELYGIPAIGWTAPAFNRTDTYFGGGMYGTAGLGVDYGEVQVMPGAALDAGFSQPPGTYKDVTFDGHSAIQFWKMAPTVAWNINDKASVGIALNLDYQSVSITERFNNVPFWVDPNTHVGGVTQQSINLDLGRPTSQLGYGFTIGGLYDITDWLTVGAMYSSKQNFGDAEFRVGTGDVQGYNGATGKAGTYKMDLQFPQQAAIGVAIKPMDKLLVDLDAKWIDWSNTHNQVDFKGPKNSFNAAQNPTGKSNSTKLDFGWDDQYVYAIGIQYAAMDNLMLRTGYNYSKSPIGEEDVFNNLVFPAVVEQHWAIGGDYQFGPHWGLGLTYMKAFKNTVKGKNDVSQGMQYATPFTKDSKTKISLEEDSVGMQISYRF